MLNIILSDTELLREFRSSNKFPKDIKLTDMINILIKDYYIKRQDREEIYKNIMEDLKESLGEEFVYTKWNNTVKIMINVFFKFIKTNKIETIKMHDISEIRISKNELDKIKELKDLVLEKLSFVLLVYAKINYLQNPKTYQKVKDGEKKKKIDYWVNQSFNIIFKEAKVGLKGDEQKKKINKLYEKKYISMSKMNNKTSIKINYVDKESIKSEEDLVITDFDGVVYQYLLWKGEKWRRCEICGKWIRIKGIKDNSKKYCSTCAKSEKIRKTIENRKKLKSK